ncbi:MAG TPA: thymidylate synthase [Candidatus Marinimicrobia bacterium]|nr:thymidylate synthase [Candidatus Neomarinimicrobiota bacterium]HRS51998.1 thymidylate synthase [Candidatus Neomarinimicrobiota bacterium]HRU91873.1 thymidylate synthase [Candidatus Neomarinimicrobiota bacterium]
MNGQIPVLMVNGESLAAAWEKSLVELYQKGCDIKTEYDKPSDPPSKDCTMIIVVQNPLSEPMIHCDFPGGLIDLQEYVLEVLEGIKDHCIRSVENPADARWEYTYHQRLFNYQVPGSEKVYDQIAIMVEKLIKVPYTRRAQAITWKVWEDNDCYDPPCLQSVWCRLLKDDNSRLTLNTNVRFRSNDAYKAAFMNMFALTQLQVEIANRIEQSIGEKINIGRYVHQADSYHLYGSYFDEFQNRFLKALETRSFEERTFRYADVKSIMLEAIPQIREKAARMGRE